MEATPSGKKNPALTLTLPPAPSLLQLGVLYEKGQGFLFYERCKARAGTGLKLHGPLSREDFRRNTVISTRKRERTRTMTRPQPDLPPMAPEGTGSSSNGRSSLHDFQADEISGRS